MYESAVIEIGSKPLDTLVADHSLSNLMAAIGKPAFEEELGRCLCEMFSAEFVHICHIPTEKPEHLISLADDGSSAAKRQGDAYVANRMWRHDPSMVAGSQWSSRTPVMFRLDVDQPETKELRDFYQGMHIRERVLVCGLGPDGNLSLSVVRSEARGPFSDLERHRLSLLGDIAFPLLSRHYGLLHDSRRLPAALTSLDLIERCMALASEPIPRREAQVAARMLYGVSTEGTAIDLGIGPETVVCYRKRFYKRIGIASFRELLLWYLGLYGEVGFRIASA